MTDKSAIIVKPSTAQAFETLWKRGRVLFFSAPCGLEKTVLADTLLDGRPVLRLNAADTGFALPSLEGWRMCGHRPPYIPVFCSQGLPCARH